MTAMQELLKELDNEYSSPMGCVPIMTLISKIESKLEKEKEQIMNAYNNAIIIPYTDMYIHKIQGKSPITKGEEYYNKTYN